MTEPLNGFRYLELAQKRNASGKATSSDLASYLEARAREAGVPLSGTFELTPLCNFDCRMCYVHLMKDQLGSASVLAVDQWKDLMSQACRAGMLTGTLTGGECLAYPGFEELFLHLQDMGCHVNVLTNGSLLDERKLRFFREHKPGSVQITLYGSNDDVYERVTGQRAFTTVANGIRELREAGIMVTATVTPNRYLGEDALETLKAAYDLAGHVKVNTCLINPREETGRTVDGDEADLDLYIRLFLLKAELEGKPPADVFSGELPEAGNPCPGCAERGMMCSGGRTAFTINWKGIMTFCNVLDRVQYNALEDGVESAWKKLNQAAREWPNAPECQGCPYESVCPTCSAIEVQFAEPGKKPSILCERTKALVRHGIWEAPVCE